MEYNGCCICGFELVYDEVPVEMKCAVCGKSLVSNAACSNGHFVCDECHSADGNGYIFRYCLHSCSINPSETALDIMKNPSIKMHGPEHHFLVPAVLISAYYNAIGKPMLKEEKLKVALNRAKNIHGGFCGFYGNCGAGVGAGIFISVILNATPLSVREWKLANLITAECLKSIALAGGPRCCKRDSYISIETAVSFLQEQLDVKLESSPIKCVFSSKNKQCLHEECGYYFE